MFCDAFGVSLCYVLMQQGHVIAYALRQLEVHKRNYPIHELELPVVVLMLKI